MKITSVFVLVIILCMLICVPAYASEMSGAEGGILIEASTGRVLMSENCDESLPMASTTKIMTAILTIENGDLSDTVIVSENASGIEGSSIWLGAGEEVLVEDLLFGLMLSSGNDAAVACAEYIAGSVDGFVSMMNEKARELGAENTHFVTVNGLHDEDHYTSAEDLAKITAYAMKNDIFRNIVKTEYHEMPWQGHEYNRVLKNKNRNLWEYDGANGVKTGYTTEAGRCYVASAERDGMEVICVLLNDYEMFEDSRKIMDYAFTNYSMLNIVNEGSIVGSVNVEGGLKDKVDIMINESFSYPLTSDEQDLLKYEYDYVKTCKAPLERGDVLGKLTVYLGDDRLFSTDITACEDVIENTYEYNLARVLDSFLFG